MTTLRELTEIGVARPRLDSEAKLTGATRYAADLDVRHLLHARLVLSPFARARIRGVDRDEALRTPGVVAVLTADDLPLAPATALRHTQPLARSEAVFAGQPVAIVVAEREAAAEDGVEVVVVDYEPLDPVLDLEAAMTPETPRARERDAGEPGPDISMHAELGSADSTDAGELAPNVVGAYAYVQGDVEELLSGCDAVVRGRFRTGWVHQGYLEPQVCVAEIEQDGSLVVETSTHGALWTRQELCKAFGLPSSRLRVVAAPVGGSFGAKCIIVEPLALGAALALRRPVRLALTRSEDFAATTPAPAVEIDLEIGARADGELVAIRTRVLVDAGAFPEWSVAQLAGARIAGPYRWRAWELRSYDVLTNRFGSGAYRAPAGPQTAFALESLLDEVAERLALDPLELRLRNAVRPGDSQVIGGEWPRTGLPECLEAVRAHPLWQRRTSLPRGEGVGLAAGVWGGSKAPCSAVARLDAEGHLTVLTGAVDLTGSHTSFAAIAAEAFGLPFERVTVALGDSATAPFAPLVGGSVSSYSIGLAVKLAAEDAREQLLQAAASELEIAPWDLEIADGVVRPVDSAERGVPLADLAARHAEGGSSRPPIEGHGGSAIEAAAPGAAVQLVHVRVDEETGEVKVLGCAMAQDCGRALNPALVEGQMRGGVAQGLGWGLYEELRHDEAGTLLTGSFVTYTLPRAEHVPAIETILVEVSAPEGPFGARGVGEASVIPGAAAVANAIAAATGVRLRELPMTPARVWRALSGRLIG